MAKFMIPVAAEWDLISWKAHSKGWEGIHPLSDACVCRQQPRLEGILGGYQNQSPILKLIRSKAFQKYRTISRQVDFGASISSNR